MELFVFPCTQTLTFTYNYINKPKLASSLNRVTAYYLSLWLNYENRVAYSRADDPDPILFFLTNYVCILIFKDTQYTLSRRQRHLFLNVFNPLNSTG